MDNINCWDISVNFWEIFPEYSPIFSEIYTKDKTKSKSHSSSIMWCIRLMYDTKSKWKNLSEKEKIDLCESEILNKKNFFSQNKELVKKLGVKYKQITTTPARKYLETVEETMEERSNFLKNIKYDASTWKMKEEMIKNTPEVISNLKKAYDMLIDEEDSIAQGGRELSLLDKEDV